MVDAAPPAISSQVPADGASGSDRRPAVGFTLTDVGTGVDASTLHVILDGVDVTGAGTFAGGDFSYLPGTDLAFGSHQLRVTVSDRSGNPMPAAQWSFSVVDTTPPQLSDVRPDDGSAGSDRTPAISVAIADPDGSGVDPSTIVMAVDGTDVSASGTFAGGRFTYTPTVPLGFATHTVSVRAADLGGNVSAPVTWSFVVRDELAPIVSSRLPAPGTTVAGAATIAFDATDAGTGIDPATLSVTVDGSDVASWGVWASGHFSYAPGNLGAGVHTVAVTVGDHAGNVAGPVMWQFAVADPATLSLRATGGAGSLVYGGRTTLTFAARSGSSALAGARVLVSTRPAGQAAFGPGRTLVASAAGVVAWPVAPARTTVYRIALVDAPAVTVTHTVVVHARVSVTVSAARLVHGHPLRLFGRLAPGHPYTTVELQLLTRSGWVTVSRPRTGALSGYSTIVIPPTAGRYLFRVLAPATASVAGGTSRTVAVSVG